MSKPLLLSDNLKLRIISATILIPITLAAIIWGGTPYQILILICAILMSFEWTNLISNTKKRTLTIPERNKWDISGIVLITTPCISMLLLRDMEQGLTIVTWMMASVWATDIGAFLFGRTIGGPKLIPSISPNKTWAGLGGGIISSFIVGLITLSIVETSSTKLLLITSILLPIAAQTGDFLESWIKRYFGVKDSGATIPGHGGVLDRVDSLITVSPLILLIEIIGDIF